MVNPWITVLWSNTFNTILHIVFSIKAIIPIRMAVICVNVSFINAMWYWKEYIYFCNHVILQWVYSFHSVVSPSMVDPQWNIWHWGSKWNLHRVCWSAVCCEWGTTSVYFGITNVCFIPSRFLSVLLSPSANIKIFYFCQKYHLKNAKSSKNYMLV